MSLEELRRNDMIMLEKNSCAKIAEVLNKIDVKRLKRLAGHDGDIKTALELVDVCKKSLAVSKKKKISWLNVARVLAKKIMSYDPLHINFEDKKRKNGTWCMWLTWDAMTEIGTLTWDAMTEIGTMSGYSLVSEHANSRIHEDAAKSFVEDFCRVGPDCLKIFSSPYTRERQRLANAAMVAAYKELDSPKTAEDVYAKLVLGKNR